MALSQPKSPATAQRRGDLTTPCYCANCKRGLTVARILGTSCAWCPTCKNIVSTSVFEVPSWIIGVVTVLLVGVCFSLWI